MINMYVQIFLRLNLIVVFLLLIRKMIGNRLRKKFVYGLWIVVPVFLLSFPFVRLPRLFHWEMNLVDTNLRTGSDLLEAKEMSDVEFTTSIADKDLSDLPQGEILSQNENLTPYEVLTQNEVMTRKGNPNHNSNLDQKGIRPAKGMKLSTVLGVVYLGIVSILLLQLILSNIRFHISCKKKRIYLCQSKGAGLPVYRLEGIVSPFLMGKNIYLPSYLVEEEQIRYAILHEESHYLHGDAFWVIVRYVVLAVYFYDPVIWLAFITSGHDCELACDEEVLAKISEEEGSSYGACLLGIVEQKFQKNHRMVMTTNMSTGKKFMKERIVNIMNRKKKSRITMALAAATMLVVTGCAYEKQNVDTSKQESLTSKMEEKADSNVLKLAQEEEGTLLDLSYVKSEKADDSLLGLVQEKEIKNEETVFDQTKETVSDQIEEIISGTAEAKGAKQEDKSVVTPVSDSTASETTASDPSASEKETKPAQSEKSVETPSEAPAAQTTQAEEKVSEETKVAEVSGTRNMTQEELNAMSAWVSLPENSGFFLESFNAPRYANYGNVYYDGAGIRCWDDYTEEELMDDYFNVVKCSPEEEEALRWLDIIAIRRQDLANHLQNKVGLSIEDINLDWVYSPNYDMYYTIHSDCIAAGYTCLEGTVTTNENGEEIVTLKLDAYDLGKPVVTLKKTNDGYKILSCVY